MNLLIDLSLFSSHTLITDIFLVLYETPLMITYEKKSTYLGIYFIDINISYYNRHFLNLGINLLHYTNY
jgi:hypothetical protein